jgi:ribosomal protein L37E
MRYVQCSETKGGRAGRAILPVPAIMYERCGYGAVDRLRRHRWCES